MKAQLYFLHLSDAVSGDNQEQKSNYLYCFSSNPVSVVGILISFYKMATGLGRPVSGAYLNLHARQFAWG
jgi:hypothetical protein